MDLPQPPALRSHQPMGLSAIQRASAMLDLNLPRSGLVQQSIAVDEEKREPTCLAIRPRC